MPAAAVIPAPIAYIKVVAVKKLVVGSGACVCCRPWTRRRRTQLFLPVSAVVFLTERCSGTARLL